MHPVLPEAPTLKQAQDYVAAIVERRSLNSSDLTHELLMLVEEVGELAKAIRKSSASGKFAEDTTRKEIDHEVADVLMMLLGICNIVGVDLEDALRNKEEINKLRVWK